MKKIVVRISLTLIILCVLAVSTFGQVSVTDRGLTFTQNKVQAAISVSTLGANGVYSTSSPWTALTGLSITSGDMVIVCHAGDADASAIHLKSDSGTPADITLVRDGGATNNGNTSVSVWSGVATSTRADWYIVVTNTSAAKAVSAYKSSGIEIVDLLGIASATGSGTTPSSGATSTLSQSAELGIGAIAMEEESDEAGTWTTGAGYVSGNEQIAMGDGGGAKSATIMSVAEVLAATTAQTAAQTGTLNNDWAACVVTYCVRPSPPTSLASPSQTDTTIDLTWTTGVNADKTHIRFQTGSYPATVADGAPAYFNTGESGTAPLLFLSDDVTYASGIYSIGFVRRGTRINAFPAETITKVGFWISRLGSISGTAYIRVRRVSDDGIISTVAEIDASVIPTDATLYEYDTDISNPTEQDLRFTVEYSEGSLNNYVKLHRMVGALIPGTISSSYESSWSDTDSLTYATKVFSTSYPSLTPATTYYFRAWGYSTALDVYSSTTADLTQATSGGAEEADISNTPSFEQLGVLSTNSTYWAKNGINAPSFPLTTGNCTFQLTNNSSGNVTITAVATDFTGGVGWVLTDAAPGENTVRLSLFKAGDGSTDNVTIITTPRTFKSALASSATLYWDLKLETGTFTDPAEKSSTITLTATLD